jgi:hypothetical protein
MNHDTFLVVPEGGFFPEIPLHVYATVYMNKNKKTSSHVYVLNIAVREIKSIKCIKIAQPILKLFLFNPLVILSNTHQLETQKIVL